MFWQIIAVCDEAHQVLYPLLLYPGHRWSPVTECDLVASIREVRTLLGNCVIAECCGVLMPTVRRGNGDRLRSSPNEASTFGVRSRAVEG